MRELWPKGRARPECVLTETKPIPKVMKGANPSHGRHAKRARSPWRFTELEVGESRAWFLNNAGGTGLPNGAVRRDEWGTRMLDIPARPQV